MRLQQRWGQLSVRSQSTVEVVTGDARRRKPQGDSGGTPMLTRATIVQVTVVE